MLKLWQCLFVLLLIVNALEALRHGDVIRISKRSQYRYVFTEWSEMQLSQCPRFLYPKQMELGGLNPKEYDSEYFKLQFSLLDGRFMTPWIVVNEHGVVLTDLLFKFIYAGDDIIDVDWHTTYAKEDTSKGQPITIRYEWEEAADISVTIGLGALVIPGAIIGMLSMLYTMIAMAPKLRATNFALPTKQSNFQTYQSNNSNSRTLTSKPPTTTQMPTSSETTFSLPI